jgi:metallo-beta-lactamase class B
MRDDAASCSELIVRTTVEITALWIAAVCPLGAQTANSVRVDYPTVRCPSCADWSAPQQPFRIFGNTYYVGTHGLSSILVTSQQGHVLIDGALPASAPQILGNIRALGFRVEDVRLILNSHVHFDHAGGIAALQRASGARVAAMAWSAGVMERGESDQEDPQYGILNPFPPARDVQIIHDGDTLRVGTLALVAHATPGHTPGGTSWTWRSCEGSRCLDLLYADSQTAVSADDFLFTHNTRYPTAEADFARGLATLEGLPCDILLTPHPGASSFFERKESNGIVDRSACKAFVAAARDGVAARMARERAK